MSERLLMVEAELDTLFLVSQLLNSTRDLHSKLKGILEILHERSGLRFGMITLRSVEDDSMGICEIYGEGIDRSLRFQPGDGLVGSILDEGGTIVVERIADEPRFLNRLGVYDPDLPFIGSPLAVGQGEVVGILAAQPCNNRFLGEHARFMEMVANLIAHSVNMLRVLERKQSELVNERDYLKQTLVRNYRFENIIGHSEPMLKVFDIIRQVAKWQTTVLIRGESGTGKEVVANAIHFNSACANGPFLKLNCAALPDNLLESELFGHEKGAFSGAVGQRKGRFELADNGTLFLDEIGEISA
jgi:Nif-specific regulatory protein